MEKKTKWRWGKNRWFVLLFTVLGAVAAHYFPPVRPEILVAPEAITSSITLPVVGTISLTNTLVASMIISILLILMALAVRNTLKKGDLAPKGITGALEMLVEYLYNMTESTAGKWAKTIFPYFMTIVLVVLLSNWMELLPGVDSFGWLEHAAGEGHATLQLFPGLTAIVNGTVTSGQGSIVVPWVRVPSTDLNFTIALALISVVMTQVIGLRAQGIRYFSKFFNTTTLFKKPFFGVMDWAVSILELISEFSKVLSFAFRLFGNIFAGSVLLFIVGSLIPVFAQSAILVFEFAIGLIQALVFGLLTMVFMSMATKGHGEHEESHSEA